MAKPTSAEFRKRKKEHIWINGTGIRLASEAASDFNVTEEDIHVYGHDSAIPDMSVDSSSLSFTIYEKDKSANKLLAMIVGKDPYSADDAQSWTFTEQAPGLFAWSNLAAVDNSGYYHSTLWIDWKPKPGAPEGAANDKAVRVFEGNAETRREFNKPIFGERLASGNDLSNVPVEDPDNALNFAVAIVVYDNDMDQEIIEVTPAMVAVTKTVTWSEIDDALEILTSYTYGFFIYLVDTAVQKPTFNPGYLSVADGGTPSVF